MSKTDHPKRVSRRDPRSENFGRRQPRPLPRRAKTTREAIRVAIREA
jgi:hypothetical protein